MLLTPADAEHGTGFSTNLMLTSRILPFFDLLMAEVYLDPLLRGFWEGFPCPPPWNTGLLHRVNWTGCLGENVGERVKLFMVDKCRIEVEDDEPPLLDQGERLETEICATPCKVIIVLACVLVVIVVLAGIMFFLHRKQKEKPRSPSSPSHQTALNPGDSRYYTSCHYASAPVVPRQVETTLRGSRMETRVLNGDQLQQPYPPLPPGERPYGQVRPEMGLPVSNTFTNYRKLEGDYTPSTASQSNSDKSPIYEYIEDSDSIRDDRLSRHSRDVSAYCECQEHGYNSQGYSSDGIYSDRGTQTTLPIRHFHRHDGRHDSRHERDIPYGSPQESFDIDDSSMSRREARGGQRSRRRPGSGTSSHDSRHSYREGSQRRQIPALHPHYFCPPELTYR
ncbi:uncharacterized protein LOC124275564 isoform X1 [Haliotis rubra]|uniref:uncharacterized protein LOC124275564 isoform X1 n=2 Tax=Haliotis rubra TaxID=36100 RepID=UPI001EE588C1|nr:uncharacterized protein LOC124275564 isoform X1 [Haliotis rubra]